MCGTGEEVSEEIRQRIDVLMAELTRLMDNYENHGSQNLTSLNNFVNITNNFSMNANANTNANANINANATRPSNQ